MPTSSHTNTNWPLWEVFIQPKSGAPFEHAGSIHAPDREMAIQNARDVYTRRSEGRSLWIVPSSAIIAASPSDEASLFDPADDKIYRHPQFYKLPKGTKL